MSGRSVDNDHVQMNGLVNGSPSAPDSSHRLEELKVTVDSQLLREELGMLREEILQEVRRMKHEIIEAVKMVGAERQM